MSHTNLNHRRTHNLLLVSKLLNQRDTTSPFTLVLDDLEQPAKPLLREYIRRARISKTISIFLSFETFVRPKDVDVVVQCFGRTTPDRILNDVRNALGKTESKRAVVIIDSLTTLSSMSNSSGSRFDLVAFLSSLIQLPQESPSQTTAPSQVSLVAVYHNDLPPSLPSPPSQTDAYRPTPLSLLSYLATTIIKTQALSILLTEKAARSRSLAAPAFGLGEEMEGVIVGLKPKAWTSRNLKPEERGLVLELEHRRKSGRGVLEWYFLPTISKTLPNAGPQAFREIVSLLDDHPLFRQAKDEDNPDQELSGMTFELGLTDRQRQEREGVVLPYFDAQKTGGGGEGGRILYDLGVEDDFDEEEDEI